MKDKVEVYISDIAVGHLSVDEYGTLCFQYSESYLSSGREAISYALPLSPDMYYGNEAHAFFTGLLPEEDILSSMAKAIGTSPTNYFKLLVELGRECIGAIQIGSKREGDIDHYRELTTAHLQEIIDMEEGLLPGLYKNEDVRLSMAGAQSKVGLLYKDKTYFLPKNGAPSNIIVKPSSSKYPSLVYNEYCSMRLANAIGIDVPKVRIDASITPPLYTVERYDRAIVGSKVLRLHQEDFCQALNIQTRNKYENDGGPNFTTCIELLRKASSVPAADINKFITLFLFNLIIGNKDAHAKNYSMLRIDNRRTMAPAYDLVSTTMYPVLSSNMAMSVNGKFELESITEQDMIEMAEDAQINGKSFLKEYYRIKKAILGVMDQLLKDDILPSKFRKDFKTHIKQTVKALPF